MNWEVANDGSKFRQLKNIVEGVEVFYRPTKWKRYAICVLNNFGEYKNIYQDKKPTIKELRDYKDSLKYS